MSRIRTIKPDFWTDEKVVAISPLARLVFIGLWNFVDDFGRAKCSPTRLKMQILPADNADFPQLLAEISASGMISIYDVDGESFLQVNGFTEHQKIDKRAKSKFPPPPNPAESRRIFPLEGKGMEGNGRENADAIAPPSETLSPSPPSAAAPSSSPEKLFFDQAAQLLGPNGRSLAAKLLKSKQSNALAAHAALLTAAQKSDPREYLGAIIRGREGAADRPDRSW